MNRTLSAQEYWEAPLLRALENVGEANLQDSGLAPVLWTVNVPSKNDGTRFRGGIQVLATL